MLVSSSRNRTDLCQRKGKGKKGKKEKGKRKKGKEKRKGKKEKREKGKEKSKKKEKFNRTHWRIRVSIPVPPACKAGDLPIDLIPQIGHRLQRDSSYCQMRFWEANAGTLARMGARPLLPQNR